MVVRMHTYWGPVTNASAKCYSLMVSSSDIVSNMKLSALVVQTIFGLTKINDFWCDVIVTSVKTTALVSPLFSVSSFGTKSI